MALKDWKNIYNTNTYKQWKNNEAQRGHRMVTFIAIAPKNWVVYYPYDNTRHFKTKKQALKYAKSYMRKH